MFNVFLVLAFLHMLLRPGCSRPWYQVILLNAHFFCSLRYVHFTNLKELETYVHFNFNFQVTLILHFKVDYIKLWFRFKLEKRKKETKLKTFLSKKTTISFTISIRLRFKRNRCEPDTSSLYGG